MDKRGQLYLVSALIIAFVVYIILSPSNVVKTSVESSNFEAIAKNFDRESARFLNTLFAQKQWVYDAFLNFTILFTSYAKTKNPDVGVVYTFAHEGKLYFGNYAKDQVTFEAGGVTVIVQGCLDKIATSISAAGLNIAAPQIAVGTYQQCLKEIPVPGGFNHLVSIIVLEQDTGLSTSFVTEVTPSHPDLILISKEKKGSERRIYTKGRFI